MSKTNYLEAAVLNAVLNNTSLAVAVPYVALFTAVSSEETPSVTEVTGGSYARVNGAAAFPAATVGTCANDAAITFPAATASWGTVTYFGIYDASTAGNLLYVGAVSPSKTIDSGDTASFAIGALTVTED